MKSDSNSVDIEEVKAFISILSEDKLKEYRENYELYLNDNPFFRKILEKKGFDSDIIQYQWFRFVGGIMKNADS